MKVVEELNVLEGKDLLNMVMETGVERKKRRVAALSPICITKVTLKF